jgi:ribosomal protein S18 acetylase RimI-like enzyme
MPAAAIRVADADRRPVGFIALLDSFIGGLFVDPAAHGRGIGRLLVLDALAKHPCLHVEVYEANAGARTFYARLGFRETGRRETDDQGRPWPLLRLRLEAGPDDRTAQRTGPYS